MRYRDQPTVEVTQPVRCDVAAAWNLLTDIELPVRCSPELRAVRWLGDADAVRVGARFRGTNHNDALAPGKPTARSSKVEDQGDVRRWVWNVLVPDGVGATWGLRGRTGPRGVLIRQWGQWDPTRRVSAP